MIKSVRVVDVIVGDRRRKDPGDIKALAASISEIGLLHPIVVTPENRLVVGERRLLAYKHLKRAEIPAYVVENMAEAIPRLLAERDENTCRKDFTATEAVYIGREIKKIERAAAKKRQANSTGGPIPKRKPACVNFTQAGQKPANGPVRDKVGAAVGMAGVTWDRANAIVAAAEEDPEKFGDLPQLMEDKSVSNAYGELCVRRGGDRTTKRQAPPRADTPQVRGGRTAMAKRRAPDLVALLDELIETLDRPSHEILYHKARQLAKALRDAVIEQLATKDKR